MKLKRFAAVLLAAVMCVGLMPLRAEAAKSTVKIKDMSSDFLSGYYVIYEYNGTELRSDMLGPNVNYDLWNMLPAQEKKDVITNFAFGPSWMQTQFGKDNVAKMNNWWNDATGWSGARKILQDRIAQREFPRAHAAFDSTSWVQQATVELPDVEHKPTEAYDFLPEVKAYFDNEKELELTWRTGQRAYRILVYTKDKQIAAAVTSLSGDLISLICERALVPAITPGGLSALAPNLTGELLSIADKITGISDKIIEKAVGKRVDASTARKIIDQCWEIINLNEQYCDQCISHFVSCKGKKADLYQEAADAVAAYIEENGEIGQANLDKIKEIVEGGEVTPTPMEFSTREEFAAAWNEFYDNVYQPWFSASYKKAEEFQKRLSGEVMKGALGYDKWPQDWSQPDSMQTLDLSAMYTPDSVKTKWVDGKPEFTFLVLLDELPDAFTKAMKNADEHIDKMEQYIEDYNAEFEALAARWQELRSEWLGYKAAADAWEYRISDVPTDTVSYSIFERLYSQAGKYHDESLDNMLKKLQAYRESLDEREQEWDDQSEALKEDLMGRCSRIIELQARHDALAAEATKLVQQIHDIITESDATYYNDYGEIESAELKQRLQDASPWGQPGGVDFTAFQALYDELGETLQDMWDRYDKAHTKWLEDQLEMEELENEFKALVGSKNVYYNTFTDSATHVNMLSELCGREIKTWKEMIAAHLTASWRKDDGWNNTYLANPEEGQILYNLDADNFRKSYAEFSGRNGAVAEAGITYDQMIEYKGNYMRYPERRENIKNALLDGLVSNVNRAGSTCQYTANFYAKGCADSRAKVEGVLNGWAAGSAGYKPVTGLSRKAKLMADGYDLTLVPGETYDLGKLVTVSPADATDRSLTWESNAYYVCWVDDNGRLTAMNPGEATITVSVVDNGWKYSGGVKVYEIAPITFTVRVGAGSEATGIDEDGLVPMQTFGDGKLYDAVDNGDGTMTVSLGVGLLEENQSVAAALYSGDGRLYGLRYLTPADFETQSAAFTAPGADGLVLKVLAIDAGAGLIPQGAPILCETIK